MTWRLLAKYLSGNTDSEEDKKIKSWLESSEENRKNYEAIKKLWDTSGEIIARQKWHASYEKEDYKKVLEVTGIPGDSKDEQTSKSRNSKIKYLNRKNDFSLFVRIAAVLTVIIIGGYLLNIVLSDHTYETVEAEQQVFNEIYTERGQSANLSLDDGTEIQLGKESSIQFKTDKKSRQVKLNGEAYFEVKEDPRRPFSIQTSDATVRVLGTDFNIRAYDDEDDVQVAVVNGRVSFKAETEQHYADTPEEIRLNAGEVGIYDRRSRVVNRVEVDNQDHFLSWKRNRLIFEDAELNEVIAKLERWYDVNFELEDRGLSDLRLTANLDARDLDSVLEVVGTTLPIDFKRESNRTIMIVKDGE